MIVTVKVAPDEIRPFDEWAAGHDIVGWAGLIEWRDTDGCHRSMFSEDFFSLSESERTAILPEILRSHYEWAVNRLGSSNASSGINFEVMKDSARERIEKAIEIVSAYNRDCSDIMTDYFNRSIYDWYAVKVA